MRSKKGDATRIKPHQSKSAPDSPSHARIIAAVPSRYLDPVQLHRLEQAFRRWAQAPRRADIRLSRQRILLIFLLIRYTGAKLKEVLAMNPFRDIDHKRQVVVYGRAGTRPGRSPREVQIPETLSGELREALADPAFRESLDSLFKVDPGHVRRKFYERAAACGFPKELGGPDAIRKSRAVELMQNNLPLPVVQRILGHSTPNLTASFVSFSDDDMQRVTRFFLEKESRRTTSARNAFFGKISAIHKGDIQSRVELVTIGGYHLASMITNDSLSRLGLKIGMLITAEVKAPWVILQKAEKEPRCSADNRVLIADGTEVCSLVTSDTSRRLDLREQDPVWAMFTSFSVVLHLD